MIYITGLGDESQGPTLPLVAAPKGIKSGKFGRWKPRLRLPGTRVNMGGANLYIDHADAVGGAPMVGTVRKAEWGYNGRCQNRFDATVKTIFTF